MFVNKKIIAWSVSLVLLAAVIGCILLAVDYPEIKARQFVNKHGPDFSALVESGNVIPEEIDGVRVDTWSGEHKMYEFLLGVGIGDKQYWGVYYSPEDIPLAYQNTAVPLLESEEGWEWQAQGDNHGSTRKLENKWYYFEASF